MRSITIFLVSLLFRGTLFEGGLFGALLEKGIQCEYKKDWMERKCSLADDIYLTWYDNTSGTSKKYPLKTGPDDIFNDNFDSSLPLNVYFEGFRTSKSEKHTYNLTQALRSVEEANTFIIDYSKFAKSSIDLRASLIKAVENSFEISVCLKDFFKQLFEDNHNLLANIRFIGNDLGAHIVGMIGYLLTNVDDIVVPTCVGLDPLGLCFDDMPKEAQLSSEDCGFVMIILTNSKQFGTVNKLGDVNVLANCRGEEQPYCSSQNICYYPTSLEVLSYGFGVPSECSHVYAMDIYLNTIYNSTLYDGFDCNSGSSETVTIGHSTNEGYFKNDICIDTFPGCGKCPGSY